MNGVQVKSINFDALSMFFKKHISKDTLVREVMSIKFLASFEPSLTNSQLLRTKKDLTEIIQSNDLKNLTNYIFEIKNQIAVNHLLKKTNTSSSVPMLGLMYEIYMVLSLFVKYSRKTGLPVDEFQLIPERYYREFISTLAVKNNEVSTSIAHLIDWDAYISCVSLKIPPVELNLTQTFFASGLFHLHYSNPLTNDLDPIRIENNNESEIIPMTIKEFMNSIKDKNRDISSVSKNNIRSPFARHRRYITYESSVDNEIQGSQIQNKIVSNENSKNITDQSDVNQDELFKFSLGGFDDLLQPMKSVSQKVDSNDDFINLFKGFEKIKT